MHTYKGLLTTLLSALGGTAAWAFIDGLLGTLLALVGLVTAVCGFLWARKRHQAEMEKLKLGAERERLEIARLRAAATGRGDGAS